MSRRSAFSRQLPAIALAAILSLPAARLLAADPAPRSSLSPAIQEAIKDFSSDDFKTRQAASTKLQLALAEQLHALSASDDPEVLTRINELLQFNDGLTRWIIDTLKLPPDQRKAELDFGLQPDVLPDLALTFSTEPQKRIEGIHAIAKNAKPQATAILADFLNDPDRAVYLAAMEAVWDRKPTDAVIDALWDRAVGDIPGPARIPELPIKFHDRVISAGGTGGAFSNRKLDGNLAADVLVNLNTPAIPPKIINYLRNFDKATDPTNPDIENNKPKMTGAIGGGAIPVNGVTGLISVPLLYNPMGEPFHNVLKLAEAYKSKDTFPILYKLATEGLRRKIQSNGKDKDPYFMSNRTAPLASLVIASGQRTEDYKLRQLANFSSAWAFTDIDDENAAIKKIHDWYVANVDKNVPDIAVDALTPADPRK